jgi:hypothetical protein
MFVVLTHSSPYVLRRGQHDAVRANCAFSEIGHLPKKGVEVGGIIPAANVLA